MKIIHCKNEIYSIDYFRYSCWQDDFGFSIHFSFNDCEETFTYTDPRKLIFNEFVRFLANPHKNYISIDFQFSLYPDSEIAEKDIEVYGQTNVWTKRNDQ